MNTTTNNNDSHTLHQLRQIAVGASALLEELNTSEGISRRLDDPHYVIGQLTFYVCQLAALSKN